MEKNLILFEGKVIDILTKQDVNFDFDGDVLFNVRQVAELLGYARVESYCRSC